MSSPTSDTFTNGLRRSNDIFAIDGAEVDTTPSTIEDIHATGRLWKQTAFPYAPATLKLSESSRLVEQA